MHTAPFMVMFSCTKHSKLRLRKSFGFGLMKEFKNRLAHTYRLTQTLPVLCVWSWNRASFRINIKACAASKYTLCFLNTAVSTLAGNHNPGCNYVFPSQHNCHNKFVVIPDIMFGKWGCFVYSTSNLFCLKEQKTTRKLLLLSWWCI